MKDLTSIYLSPSFIERLTKPPPKGDLFKKALGNWPKETPLLDLCGGWGRDSLCFASWGFKASCLERHSEVFKLVSKTFQELKTRNSIYENILKNISYLNIDAKDFLKNTKDNWPLIYLDPMYPDRKKSALGKGEMRILKELVGDDPDKAELAQLAFEKTKKRLVIKGPKLSPSLLELVRPTHVFKGSSTRFEIFVKP
jgi:16S rRNA (guanine1516-N2)-methyltransferase